MRLLIVLLLLAAPAAAQCLHIPESRACYNGPTAKYPGPFLEPQQSSCTISLSSNPFKKLYYYAHFLQGKDGLIEGKKCSGRYVQLLGSLTGPGPTKVGEIIIPLDIDAYTVYTLSSKGIKPPWQSWQMFSGNSIPQLQIEWSLSGVPPNVRAALVGQRVYWCLVSYDSDGMIKSVTNSVSVEIVE